MAALILMIDDDTKLTSLLADYLAKFEYRSVSAAHPAQGMELLKAHKPDLVILDVMLPGKNGFEVLRDIRRESQVPVIMSTARGETTDKVVGLELGADDYIAKPYDPRELVARIQSVLRRSQLTKADETAQGSSSFGEAVAEASASVLSSGDLRLDLRRQELSRKGLPLELTSLEFALLALFMRHAGEVLSRDRIMDELKGVDWDAFNRSIDVAVSRLRQRIGDDPKKPRFIKTVWGSGYLFIAEVKSSC